MKEELQQIFLCLRTIAAVVLGRKPLKAFTKDPLTFCKHPLSFLA
jgi:hypothetical protein